MVFGLGGLGVRVDVKIDPSRSERTKVVVLDHAPSWKVRKSPYHFAIKRSNIHPSPQSAESIAGQYGGIASASSSSAYQVNPYTVPGSYPPNMNMNRNMPRAVAGRSFPSNQIYAFDSSQHVSGTITLSLTSVKKFDHLGIKAQFVGRISTPAMQHLENRSHYDFVTLSKELAPPGSIYTPTVDFQFEFKNMEKPYETYHGRNCYISYLVRVFIEKKFQRPHVEEKEIIVQKIMPAPTINEPIKMEVGIEDCLHIEFEYEKRRYHLKDVIEGKIHFLLVKIKIKYMELAVIRRETSGDVPGGNIFAANGPGGDQTSKAMNNNSTGENKNVFTETQTLIKHEIMDGAPVKGEVVPVRLHLGGIPADLTPTFESAQNKRFSVRYFLNLVLVDEEDRRYFKQQEIILWRKELGN